jgi:hypothetical protein
MQGVVDKLQLETNDPEFRKTLAAGASHFPVRVRVEVLVNRAEDHRCWPMMQAACPIPC